MTESELRVLAATTLKSIARNEQIKAYIENSKDLHPLLLRAARRFIAGETMDEAVGLAAELGSRGYAVSLDYIGENTPTAEKCGAAAKEFASLTRAVGDAGQQAAISLDLSHIGLTVDQELARRHLL